MAYIAYSTPKANGAVYATVVESTREGSKVKQQRIENLGRVIDVQKGIFKTANEECSATRWKTALWMLISQPLTVPVYSQHRKS